MRMTQKVLIIIAISLAVLSAAPANTVVMDFGNTTSTVNADFSNIPYTQNVSSTQFSNITDYAENHIFWERNTSISLPNFKPQNLFLNFSLSGANPNSPFHIDLYNVGFNEYYTFAGDTSNATSSTSNIALNYIGLFSADPENTPNPFLSFAGASLVFDGTGETIQAMSVFNLNFKSVAVWNSGSGNWTTTSQWNSNTPPVDGDTVEFSGAGGTSTNDFASGNLSAISGLTFTSNATGAYTVNGNTLQVGEDGIANASNQTQTIAINLTLGANQTFAANTANLVVSGNISGGYALTKEGNQTLTLAGANTYTGETSINAGTVAIASGGSLAGTSKIFVGNSTSDNALEILGSVGTGNLTLSHQVGSDNNTVTVGGGSSPASLTVSNLLNLGFGGTGNTLNILGNGTVTAGSTEIGGYGANNTLNLTGGHLNSTGYLVVGYNADGNALNITSGGNATVGSVTVGLDAGSSNNTILVSGSGSALHTPGLIYLGQNGTNNSLLVQNGGKVVSGNPDAVIGFNAGSNGNDLSINGTGSQFTNNGTLYIGRNGSENSLTVQNGASVVTSNSRIGHEAVSSNNTATVSGAGTTWANTGTLRVGNLGSNNTLAVTSGANVTISGDTFIGHGAGSENNLVSVEGAGSSLNLANAIVGLSGSNNKLLVADSGTINAIGIQLSGTNATLQIGNGAAGGTITTSLGIGTGTGTSHQVIFNHTDSNLVFSPILTGNLSVSQIGTGTTTLTASNTYTGITTIDAGILATSGNDRIATGNSVIVNAPGTFTLGGNQTLASVSGTGTIQLGDYILSTGDSNSTYSGTLAGNGGLTKSGNGTFTLTGNGTFTGDTNITGGTLVLASNSTLSKDAVVIMAAGTTLTVNQRTFIGALEQGGGTVNGNGTLVVTLTITDSGSLDSVLANGPDYAAGILKRTSGTTTIGAANTFTGVVKIQDGILQLTGNGSFDSGSSLVLNPGGTMDLNNKSQTFSAVSGAGGTISMGSGSLTVNQSTDTTYNGIVTGSGSLNKQGGGTLTLGGNNTYNGSTTVSAGTLAVTGSLYGTSSLNINAGSVNANSGNLAVIGNISLGGASSNNTLQISNGGAVSGYYMSAGFNLGANNNLVTVGANSTLTLSDKFDVGFDGSSNNLTITNGGQVFLGAGGSSIGSFRARDNSVLIDGPGSKLTNVGVYYVGFQGEGNQLTLSNQGRLVSDNLSAGGSVGVGVGNGSNNTILVTSNASMLINGELSVGGAGASNSMTISGGGNVTSTEGFIGRDIISSNNTVTVTGTNSTWTNNGTLYVGYQGSNNTLAVANSGTVTASSISIASQAGSGGTLNIGTFGGSDTGGTINAPSIAFGNGTGTINFNQSNAMSLSGNISGNGSVNKLGTGTTTLSGANTYTGSTTISAGTLAVTGSLNGTTSLDVNGGSLAVTGGVTANGSVNANSGTITIGQGGALNVTGSTTTTTTIDALFASNRGSSTISVFDRSNNAFVAAIGSGHLNTPLGLAISSNGSIYAANNGGNSISIFGANGAYTGNIMGNLNYPYGLAISSNGTLYAANYYGNSISIFGANGTYTGNITANLNRPEGLAISSNGTLYAANFDGNSISIFGANGTYTGNITGNLNGPFGLAISSNGTLYAANFDGNSISIFGANGTYTGNITGNLNDPYGLAISSNGTLYAANNLGNSISIFGANGTYTGNITGNLSYPAFVAIGNYTQEILVPNGLTLATSASDTATLNLGTFGGNDTTATLDAPFIRFGNGTAAMNLNLAGNTTVSADLLGGNSNSTINQLGTGTTTLTSANSTYAGGVNVSNGTLVLASNLGNATGTTISTGTLQLGDGGTIGIIGGNISNSGTLAINRSDDLVFSNTVTGAGSILKLGNNTVTYNSSNVTPQGGTTISSGKLLVTGTTSAVTINNSGILAGSGTVGAVTVNSGGAIAPGNSPGTLTTGNMTWNGGGSYKWELASVNGTAGTNWDLISSAGSLTINATSGDKLTISLASYGNGTLDGVKKASWEIGNFTAGINGFDKSYFSFNSIGMTGSKGGYSVSLGGGNTTLLLNYKTGVVWNTGTGDWTTASQWEDDSLPENGNAVEFSGSGGISTNNYASGNLSEISGLTFTSSANGSYTINGTALTLGAGGLVNDSTSTQTVAIGVTLGADQSFAANTANLVVSGNISGNASLTKAGSETLTLSGSNTYTGETLVEAGTLAIASGGSLTGTSQIFVGNSTSGNTLDILGTASTGNMTLSHQVGSNDNTVTVGGGTSPASLTVANLINVGFGGTGNTLDILGNGTVTAASTWIGGYGASNTVNLTGGVLNSTTDVIVGYFAGENALNIIAGGNTTAGSIITGLDAASTNNTILVSGSNSALNTAGLIYLGQNGTSNSLVVENGGKVVSQNKDAVIGLNAGSNGNALSINGTGSRFTNNGTLYVGSTGSNNTLSVANGGNLATKSSRIGGDAASSNNTVNVSGAGSVWNNTGTLRVGSFGSNNTLAVTSGANVTVAGNTFIGYNATSANNLVSVEGAGSVLNLANATIGLSGANNTLRVADLGTINAVGIQLSGSDSTLQIGNGAAAGTINTSLGIGTGTGSGHQVVFNHTDSNLSFSPILTGNLSLRQIGTGKTILATNNTYTGTTTVNNGTLEVASGGSINGTSDVSVGILNGDNGTLNLNGGSVSNARGYLGAQVGSVGAATVSAGNWTNSGSLFVGVGGTGSLTINGTGHVTNEDGYIGHISGSNGTVSVSGGTWTNNINLFIGNEGTGSLTINGTANVKSMFGSVGNLPGGNGTVSVSGGTWTNSLDLSIGNGGTGSLVINGTGNVTSMFGYIGSLPDGNGTVSVSGGTWTNSSNLTIGIGGTGSLTINGTGMVIVGDTLSRGSNGRINLESGGTLQIGNGGASGTLATDLTNNGTLIFDVTDSSTSGYAISGTGVVDKTGAGTLVLSGSSSNYSGATSIKAGTLLLDSGYSNTASAVSVLGNGTLGGSGTAGDVTVLANATISPGGNAPVGISTFSISSVNPEIATLTVGNLTLNGGAIYNWQTLSLNGIGEAGRDWDLIRSTGGSLSINASANSTVGIRVSTLDGGFTNQNKKAKWQIGSFTDIIGYDKSYFSVNASGTGARGRFFVTDEANSLVLNYKTAAVWLGGTGNWTTASLWEDRYIAVDGDEVEFSGNGGTSTNSDVNSVASLTFTSIASGSYTLNGNALAVGAAGIVNDSEFEHTIALNLTGGEVLRINTAESNLTISGVISGNSALSKNGSQTLTLLGTNSYIGGTTVSAGTLALGGTAGAIIGNISVDSGATFAVNRTNDATISNLISGNGSFAQVGSGVTSMVTNNTYSGGTSITSGTLWAKSARALGNGSVTLGQFEKSFSLIPPPSTAALLVSSRQEMGGNLRIDGNLDWYDGKIAYFDTGYSPLSGDLTINVAGSFTASAGDKTFDFSGVEALNYGSYTLVNATTVSAIDTSFQAAHGPYTTLYGNFTTTNQTVVYTVTGATSGGTDIQNNGGPNTPVVANYNITGPTITIGLTNKVNALTFSSNAPLAIQSNGELTVTSGTLAVQTGSSVVSGGTLVAPTGLNKDGTGELDVTNNVVVTGTAAVNGGLFSVNGNLYAGNVVVNAGGTIGGSGFIVAPNVVVNGNLSPGNSPGTLSVVGNLVLTGANSTIIEIASPTNYDRIVVSGQATLGGTLNAVAYGGGTITPGARYDFLQAGSITGEFDSLIAPDGLRIRLLNSGTVGTLLFGPGSYVPMAINQNQRNAAKALDTFIKATDGDQQTVSIALDSLTTEQFPAAFDQIMPGFYESLANIAIEQAFAQTQMLNQRISSVRLGAAGFQAMGGISQPLVHDKNGKSAAEAKDASPIVESATATNWNAWALGTGMFSRSTNLGSLQNYNNDAGGFLVGADYRWSENFVTGLYAGYDYSYAKYNGGSSTKGNSFSFGTYASYEKDGYYADAVIGGGYTGFQTQRSIAFGTIDRTASADPNSGQFTAGLNLGKDFEVGKFTLGPIVGAQYTYAGIGSFTESGAESLDLSLGQQNANSLRSTLGGRIAYTWNLNQKIALIPEVRMFWQHEFLNNPRNINASLDAGSGAAFDFETTDPYRDSVFAGAGVTAQFGKNLSGSVFYNINFGSQTYQNNMVSAGLNISF